MDKIKYDDFAKLDLRIATIIAVKDHPNADRLYVLTIRFDEEPDRQIVAGIKKHYTKEELVGKQIVVIANLEHAMLRGVESQGMVLAAEDKEGKVALLSPEKVLKNSAKIK